MLFQQELQQELVLQLAMVWVMESQEAVLLVWLLQWVQALVLGSPMGLVKG